MRDLLQIGALMFDDGTCVASRARPAASSWEGSAMKKDSEIPIAVEVLMRVLILSLLSWAVLAF